MVSWREREARNEARFRTQNEWVETAGAAPGVVARVRLRMQGRRVRPVIRLSPGEYEFVRSTSNRFAIALNHENPDARS